MHTVEKSMNRRTVVRWGIGVSCTAGLSMISGCVGSSSTEGGPDLQIADRDAEITMFGNVVATVTVVNEGDESGTGEIWVEVDLDAGDTYTEFETVNIQPDETRTYEIEVDLGAIEALTSEEAQIEVWLEV